MANPHFGPDGGGTDDGNDSDESAPKTMTAAVELEAETDQFIQDVEEARQAVEATTAAVEKLTAALDQLDARISEQAPGADRGAGKGRHNPSAGRGPGADGEEDGKESKGSDGDETAEQRRSARSVVRGLLEDGFGWSFDESSDSDSRGDQEEDGERGPPDGRGSQA